MTNANNGHHQRLCERKNHVHLVLYDNHALSIWSFDWVDTSYCPECLARKVRWLRILYAGTVPSINPAFLATKRNGPWQCINAMGKSLFSKSICLIIPLYQFLSYAAHKKWPTLTLCINVLSSDWSMSTPVQIVNRCWCVSFPSL